jgi:hypothetical protein
MKTSTVSARWRRSQSLKRSPDRCASASCYRLAEYVGFLAIVESKLKLREVQRQILLAKVMVVRGGQQ